MTRVQFDEYGNSIERLSVVRSKGGLAGWIVRVSKGSIPDERRAEYVMIVIIVLCLLVVGFLLHTSLSDSEEVKPYDGGSNAEYVF